MSDIWHHQRPEDAARLLRTLELGLVHAVSIIEPRRRGKTTFLLDDLAPAALPGGMVPVYVNLAAATGDLEAYLAAKLAAAAQPRGSGRHKLKKLSAKASLIGLELGGELEPAGAQDLEAALAALLDSGRQTLLLLDEVHRLALAQHADLAWKLRSLLDSHRRQVKVVATSSSAASCDILVSGERRAFKAWFTRVPLTPLGSGFVAHLAQVVALHFPRHPITAAEIQQAFDALGQSPKFVRDYLNDRLLAPGLQHDEALAATLRDAEQDSGFDSGYFELPALEKVVLFALGSGQAELFSAAALQAFAQVTGAQAVSKTQVQRALKGLSEGGWVIRVERGAYRIADQLFESWMAAQIQAGRLPGPQG